MIGVPGLSWNDMKASPELAALIDYANVGSITVKTAGPHTCPIDGWLTISAGTRAWGSVPDQACGELPAVADGKVADWQTYVNRQADHHTGAPIGRLAESRARCLRFRPWWSDRDARTATAPSPTGGPRSTRTRWSANCSDAIIDAGALPLREGRDEALKNLANLVGQAKSAMPDAWVLLVGVSQEMANAHQEPLVALQIPLASPVRGGSPATPRAGPG